MHRARALGRSRLAVSVYGQQPLREDDRASRAVVKRTTPTSV